MEARGVSTSKSPAELALAIYNLLVPYESDVRLKAVQAALLSLGESALSARHAAAPATITSPDSSPLGEMSLGPKALRWAQKHGITSAMLEEVFHITSQSVDVTASSVPGASKREMTVNCYLLSGLRGLLKDDLAVLDDSDAIALCKRLTAYDKNNHPTHRRSVGNRMTGAKPYFTLTGPGETAAAEVVKQMTSSRAG
jgi:hypothetical protein